MRKTRQNQEVVPNVKQIEYRKRRGEKISYLIQREQKLAEGDEDNDFWNNNKYFNDGNMEDDDESFKEKGDEKMDSYDSDFGQTTGTQQEQQDDSSVKSTKKVKFEVKANKQHQSKDYSAKKYYIHDHFTQEYLIREAVMTEEHNKISLQSLIQIEEDKKKIRIDRQCNIEGPRIKQISNAEGTTLQYFDFDGEINLFPPKQKLQVHRGKKYKDPRTGVKFNTVQEYKAIKRGSKIQDKINQLNKKLNS